MHEVFVGGALVNSGAMRGTTASDTSNCAHRVLARPLSNNASRHLIILLVIRWTCPSVNRDCAVEHHRCGTCLNVDF
jgi:hypothetical protein